MLAGSTADLPSGPLALRGALKSGTVLGSYRICELIGAGGMGRVYRAEHTRLGRQVALKQLRFELSGDRNVNQRFFEEAVAVNRIQHENIVAITDFVDDEPLGSYYIMELLEGDTLERVCERQGVLPGHRVLSIAIQAASALGAVHRAGIIHRDVKPANVFVCPRRDGSDLVKLLDFGVARLTAANGRRRAATERGTIMGTPMYMSPEQAQGQRVDELSDIYSFGVMLFEMITGAAPFQAEDFTDLAVMHVRHPVPRPSRRPGAPFPLADRLEPLIVSCMAKAPEDRVGSMGEVELRLRAELDELLFSARTSAMRTPRMPRIAAAAVLRPQGKAKRRTLVRGSVATGNRFAPA